MWTGTDGPSPSLSPQTRLEVPWGGSDTENGMGPSVPVGEGHWITGSCGETLSIECGDPTNPGAAAPMWAGADGPSLSLSPQTRLGVPWGGSDAENGQVTCTGHFCFWRESLFFSISPVRL